MFLFLHIESVPNCTLSVCYINYRSVVYNSYIMLMITNKEVHVGIYLKEKGLSYSELQGIWAFVQNKGCSPKYVLFTRYTFTSTC